MKSGGAMAVWEHSQTAIAPPLFILNRLCRCIFELAITLNERIRRTIMSQLRFFGTLKLRDDAVSKHLAQFNTPLVERVDIPDGPLREDFVLVEGNKLT